MLIMMIKFARFQENIHQALANIDQRCSFFSLRVLVDFKRVNILR